MRSIQTNNQVRFAVTIDIRHGDRLRTRARGKNTRSLESAIPVTEQCAYGVGGEESWGETHVEGVTLFCDKGLVTIRPIGRFILVLQADLTVDSGQLMHLTHAVMQHLQPLVNVFPPPSRQPSRQRDRRRQ